MRKPHGEKSGGPVSSPGHEGLGHRDVCLRCRRPARLCLCPVIRPFATRADFVVLIHPKEAKKVRNGTGRLAHLCLSGSRLIMGESFTGNNEVNRLISNPDRHAAVLYPGESSVPAETFAPDPGRTPLVFVLDGTWSGARKMIRLSGNLHGLPRIGIAPDNPSRFLIRAQPNPRCLSTIESIHALLEAWEKRGLEQLAGRHHVLIEVLDELVRTQLAFIDDPHFDGYRRRNTHVPIEGARSGKRRKIDPFFRG